MSDAVLQREIDQAAWVARLAAVGVKSVKAGTKGNGLFIEGRGFMPKRVLLSWLVDLERAQ